MAWLQILLHSYLSVVLFLYLLILISLGFPLTACVHLIRGLFFFFLIFLIFHPFSDPLVLHSRFVSQPSLLPYHLWIVLHLVSLAFTSLRYPLPPSYNNFLLRTFFRKLLRQLYFLIIFSCFVSICYHLFLFTCIKLPAHLFSLLIMF